MVRKKILSKTITKQQEKTKKKKKKKTQPPRELHNSSPETETSNDESFTIECRWRPINKCFGNKEERCGRYDGSYFYNMSGFGATKWPVVGYIEVDHEKYRKEGFSEEEIFSACLAFLNKAPQKKKHAKKHPKPEYGFLEPYSSKFKESGGVGYIEAVVSTDERSNKNFWNEGTILAAF